ncbi:cupin [Pseudomonas syringae CC1557]|uniref:Cupin n=1 Tax=Pseudomonas syringae CC1557 TaxID=1357279 RepID=W0MU40_PSESX|nr:cupin [Pseudomonas syringae]AHG42099.1 cupin [Pseudomonas syringae CC1557]
MEKEAFLKLLAAEGFGTVVEVEREAFGTLDSHAHNFEAMALVLHGSLVIHKSDGDFTYNSGDIFHLECNEPHSEVFGENGVRYLVGRK